MTTGAPLSFMDGEYVIFGRVIEGMDNLREIESFDTNNEKPNESVKIVNCGAYRKDKK